MFHDETDNSSTSYRKGSENSGSGTSSGKDFNSSSSSSGVPPNFPFGDMNSYLDSALRMTNKIMHDYEEKRKHEGPNSSSTFNPLKEASKMFDELVVGVIVNPNKTPLFTKEERVKMIEDVTAELGNVTVDCFQGLLADYVNDNHFDAVVRGLRATTDFEYEIQMAQMNDRLFNDGIESVFLMTSPEYSFISSSIL